MKDRIQEYDLTFLTVHYIFSISFTTSSTTLASQSLRKQAGYQMIDTATITLECDFTLNGKKVERGKLLSLLDQKYIDCWIDKEYNLHLQFSSGDEFIAIRNTNGFESYNIQWTLDPSKYVAII
jgi:hypothetical protein